MSPPIARLHLDSEVGTVLAPSTPAEVGAYVFQLLNAKSEDAGASAVGVRLQKEGSADLE